MLVSEIEGEAMSRFEIAPGIHHRIYVVRNALGLTQREMAQKMGYSDTYFCRIDSKPNSTITDNLIISISCQFDVRMEYLLKGEEPIFNEASANLRRLMALYESLTEKHKAYAVEFLEFLNEKGRRES